MGNDYIIIPNGVAGTAATAAGIGNTAAVTLGTDKFCGRYFSATATAADQRFDATICSRVTPFKISVFTDGIEADGASGTAGAVGQAKANEAASGVANPNRYHGIFIRLCPDRLLTAVRLGNLPNLSNQNKLLYYRCMLFQVELSNKPNCNS